MAMHRMFSKTIVQGSRFLKMPVSSRELYFQMGMSADDDGIVEAWNVMRLTNAREDDLRVLVSKGFVQILNGEDLIAYLTDWNVNNTIRKDRYHASVYKDLLCQLSDGNQLATSWQPDGNQCETEVKLSKDKLSKDKLSEDIWGVGDKPTPKTRKKQTNKENNIKLLEQYKSDDPDFKTIYPVLVEWMTYKGEKGKPYTETGVKSLLSQVKKHCAEYGCSAVADCIELSISNQYQGIIWDKLKSKPNSRNQNQNENVFLSMLEGRTDDQGRNTEDSCDTESGISDVLPWT